MSTSISHVDTQLHAANGQRVFSGDNLLQIAMPLGGIGAGCICLNGHGGLQDFSIHHKPHLTALPGSYPYPLAAFGVLHVKGAEPLTRLLEGALPPEKIYNQGLWGNGYRIAGYEGLPRFSNCEFKGEYPFGFVALSDDAIPLSIGVTGWNPFIPLDDKNSGLPCSILEYSFTNTSSQSVEFEFSYHLSHLAVGKKGFTGTRNTIIPEAGVLFTNDEEPTDETFGSAALVALNDTPQIKAMWFRGGWFDPITILWRELSEGRFTPNDGTGQVETDGVNGGSILFKGLLKPNESTTIPLALTWHFPNCNLSMGRAEETASCCLSSDCKAGTTAPAWRPYYAGQWQDAEDVALYLKNEYSSLRNRTLAFKNTLFSSTLPQYVLDAVSANLGILKSPTVLRQENGNVWGWEGCNPNEGCCYGSCTHVWNYAQALPHLFPTLERTLREAEYSRSMDEHGHVIFRAALPDGPAIHNWIAHAAADGQLGGILKLHRDYHISGDRDWLQSLYPLAQRSLEYCIATWDPDERGALFEPHHNTYDIEFWGPDGMCTTIYLGALCAMSELARELNKENDASRYEKLAALSAKYVDEQLFNGEYYFQQVMWRELRDQSFTKTLQELEQKNDRVLLPLLQADGPKYQYGTGCLSDGVIGAWMSTLYGVATPLSQANVRSHLRAVFAHNFREDLSTHVCTQRPGYAIGREMALVLCSWPHDDKPALPFPYCDEVFTGIEYQVASHLIEEDLVEEGLQIVAAVRARHDGRTRNPWNEYECGNYYARAMASYAILLSLSGFRYSAAHQTLQLAPKLDSRPFKTFFSVAHGFGTIELTDNEITVNVVEGTMSLNNVHLMFDGQTYDFDWRVTVQAGAPQTFIYK